MKWNLKRKYGVKQRIAAIHFRAIIRIRRNYIPTYDETGIANAKTEKEEIDILEFGV